MLSRWLKVRVFLHPLKYKCECGEVGESQRSVKPSPSGSVVSITTTHTNGESPVGHGCCLENRLGVKASRVRISFSPPESSSPPGRGEFRKLTSIVSRGGLDD